MNGSEPSRGKTVLVASSKMNVSNYFEGKRISLRSEIERHVYIFSNTSSFANMQCSRIDHSRSKSERWQGKHRTSHYETWSDRLCTDILTHDWDDHFCRPQPIADRTIFIRNNKHRIPISFSNRSLSCHQEREQKLRPCGAISYRSSDVITCFMIDTRVCHMRYFCFDAIEVTLILFYAD